MAVRVRSNRLFDRKNGPNHRVRDNAQSLVRERYVDVTFETGDRYNASTGIDVNVTRFMSRLVSAEIIESNFHRSRRVSAQRVAVDGDTDKNDGVFNIWVDGLGNNSDIANAEFLVRITG